MPILKTHEYTIDIRVVDPALDVVVSCLRTEGAGEAEPGGEIPVVCEFRDAGSLESTTAVEVAVSVSGGDETAETRKTIGPVGPDLSYRETIRAPLPESDDNAPDSVELSRPDAGPARSKKAKRARERHYLVAASKAVDEKLVRVAAIAAGTIAFYQTWSVLSAVVVMGVAVVVGQLLVVIAAALRARVRESASVEGPTIPTEDARDAYRAEIEASVPDPRQRPTETEKELEALLEE